MPSFRPICDNAWIKSVRASRVTNWELLGVFRTILSVIPRAK